MISNSCNVNCSSIGRESYVGVYDMEQALQPLDSTKSKIILVNKALKIYITLGNTPIGSTLHT